MGDSRGRHSGQLLLGVAQHVAELAVDREVAAVQRRVRNADGRLLEGGAEPRLAGGQRDRSRLLSVDGHHQHRREHHDHRRQQHTDKVITVPVTDEVGQHLLPGRADGDNQRIILDGPVADVALHAVDAAIAQELAHRVLRLLAQQRRIRQVIAETDHVPDPARPGYAIDADQRDQAQRADVGLAVKAREITGIDRKHDDAGKGPVIAQHGPADGNLPGLGNTPQHRHADMRRIHRTAQLVHPEKPAIGIIDAGGGLAARHHTPLFIDDAENGKQAAVDDPVVDITVDVDAAAQPQVLVADEEQYAVQALQRAHHVLFVGYGEVGILLDRHCDNLLPLMLLLRD